MGGAWEESTSKKCFSGGTSHLSLAAPTASACAPSAPGGAASGVDCHLFSPIGRKGRAVTVGLAPTAGRTGAEKGLLACTSGTVVPYGTSCAARARHTVADASTMQECMRHQRRIFKPERVRHLHFLHLEQRQLLGRRIFP